MINIPFARIMAGTIAMTLAMSLNAAAVRTDAFYTDSTLARNDDGSTAAVALGFGINFYGNSRNSAFVNNNGNITFDAALSTFTPFDLNSTAREIIAPFFADVDTRGTTNGSQAVTYGSGLLNGQNAFGVNWVDVGFYQNQTSPLNSFQLTLIERLDIAAGDFDIEFNYNTIGWETGQASGGDSNGLGGFSARAGWANGAGVSTELAGSAVNGALLDGGSNALISDHRNSLVDGRYIFRVRGGVVQPPEVPLPGAVWLFGSALLGLAGLRRRRFKQG